ncbi:glycosyl hydrolase family 61-domain-containing protein [Lasiosphaeria ovina]|uniref:lytic cellulose monooxygenase (C4-dehydrogenating) n=1 Tax=Lasiosphaeria ovina TaxID=92902 RepID=A0AAE0K4W5_9PEZI|nr:glycosyl hydrolase family 61-domain-containing protein [Lasiosphaeria ovina]
MRASFVAASVLARYTSLAAAHSMFQDAAAGTVDYNSTCVRMPPNNSPVTNVAAPEMACNAAGTKAAASTCQATAGSPFTVEMHAQPGDRSCASPAIGGNHFGPVMVYMSAVADATAAGAASGASWFKVDEIGYDAATKTWGTDALNANCGKRQFVIPAKIPAGDYLVRAEAIALHAASQVGGAQFYMSCYQVKVASSAGGQLPAGVKFPGAYSAQDPGILIDIYSNLKSYTIPGPAVIDKSFF